MSGGLVECYLVAQPGGHPAAGHVHPHQWERFGVLAGTIMVRVDEERSALGPGEWAEVPVGGPPCVVERHTCPLVAQPGHADVEARRGAARARPNGAGHLPGRLNRPSV
jgi:mannose-6-phosphate isomerase-like protein (cupin superfamily)